MCWQSLSCRLCEDFDNFTTGPDRSNERYPDTIMAELILIVNGLEEGRFPAAGLGTIIGRSRDVAVTINDVKVSRRHARVWKEGERFFVEDLGSSNGTYVNASRANGKVPLHDKDVIGIGSHLLRFQDANGPEAPREREMTIISQTFAEPSNDEIFRQDSAGKLRTILDLTHRLAAALDTDTVLSRLLDQLLVLFPHADRAQAIFPCDDEYHVRASRSRSTADSQGAGFSRSLVNKVAQERVAVLAEDVQQLESNLSIGGLGINSLMAVPMQTRDGSVLGVIGLDRFQSSRPFSGEDLHLITAVVLQAASAVENAALHEALLVKARMDGELALAREIQDGFLPSEMPTFTAGALDIFGDLQPAQEIAGDFYDCVALDDRHLAFFVADVSGKGMPAALFMGPSRALLKEAMQTLRSPAQILTKLNDAVCRNNPKFMFVTVLLGICDSATGRTLLARGGHPPAVLRRRDGVVSEVESPTGRLIGIEGGVDCFSEVEITLAPGDTLLLYTDGLAEAMSPDDQEQFGVERLLRCVEALPPSGSLMEWAGNLRGEVEAYAASDQLDDDLTLLLLRRPV